MTRFDNCQPYVEHLRREHRRLQELISQIGQTMEAWAARPTSAEPLATQLDLLRTELDRHFQEEEQGGCMDEAAARCPSLSADVKRIEAEHPQFRDELTRLIAAVRQVAAAGDAATDGDSPVAGEAVRIRNDFLSLARHLRLHETAENRVLRQGFGAEAMDAEVEGLD